jgi:hypothetical protein
MPEPKDIQVRQAVGAAGIGMLEWYEAFTVISPEPLR